MGHLAKQADAIAAGLRAAGRTVHRVNPRDRTGALPKTLDAVGEPIDVVDLIINPRDGLQIVEQMAGLGVKMAFVQPGAGSEEIEARCEAAGIEVHNGCVLREL